MTALPITLNHLKPRMSALIPLKLTCQGIPCFENEPIWIYVQITKLRIQQKKTPCKNEVGAGNMKKLNRTKTFCNNLTIQHNLSQLYGLHSKTQQIITLIH